MKRSLLTIMGATALTALSGCATVSHPSSRSNVFNDYKASNFSQKDVGNPGQSVNFGSDRYVFIDAQALTSKSNPSRIKSVVLNGQEIAYDNNFFPYFGVRESELEPRINQDQGTTKIMEKGQDYVAFMLDVKASANGIRTNIPVTRATSSRKTIDRIDLGEFNVPQLTFKMPDGQRRVGYLEIKTGEQNGKSIYTGVIVMGGDIVPNYDAGVMEIHDSNVYIGQPGARVRFEDRIVPQPQKQELRVIGEIIR